MEKLFTGIFDFFSRRKPLLYAIFLLSLAVFGFFASRVRFEEDISAIIPRDNKTEKLTEVFQNSKFADKLVMMVSMQDTSKTEPDSLVVYADTLVARLQQNAAPLIKDIRYKVEEEFTLDLFRIIQSNLPVFLEQQDYLQIDSLLDTARIRQTLENDIRLLSSPSGFAIKQIIANDPSGISFIALKKLQQLQLEGNFELYDGYIITRDHKHLLIFVTPAYPAGNSGKNSELLTQINNIRDSISSGSVRMQYFGAAAVSAGNARQLRTDTLFTQGLTVIFLILFIGFYFRRKRAPLLVLLPVVYGAAFSLACIYFLKGSISVIALGTGSIVLGIAVNYSLHVFNHHRHIPNVRQVVKDLAFPLTIGGLTTIGGFFCLEFVKSDMLKDLGLFAGFSLVGAALCSLIFLPHFIGKNKTTAQTHHHSWIDKLALLRPEHNKWLLGGVAVLTIVFFFFYNKVGFEPDMTSLNYQSSELKAAEKELNRISGNVLRSVYLVAEGKDRQEALMHNEQLQPALQALQQKGWISATSGVSVLLLSDSLQFARISFWNNYWSNGKKEKLLAELRRQGMAAGFKPSAFDAFSDLLTNEYTPLPKEDADVLQKNLLEDYVTEKAGKVTVVTILKVPQDHKQAVIGQLDNRENITVLDRQYLASRLSEIVSDDFNRIALLTSALVFVVLLLTFGRIELALVAFIPMLLSWVWILGIMGMTGMTFNIVNIIVSALIFGLGDDYSLFIMDGLLQEYKTGKKNLSSYKSSILLSAITTVAGLGVLAFAKHPALRSVAFISVTGILCVVLMSQVLIPFLFSLLVKKRAAKKRLPWTLWSWTRSVFSFLYFALVSLLLTIAGWFLIKLNPFNKEKGKAVYHYLLTKLSASVLYVMANFKKRINNPFNENFKKPAIIIANHQSFLDILAMNMLMPKSILLTNRWVWKSPVFGAAIRMADFYPVAEGAENSVELMEDRVRNGYSIIVFPEGTRSSEGPMKRFHKGAFYLAEKLNLDIIPVVLHGTGYCMTKGDYLLKNGTVTIEILPRITPDDPRFGTGYSERTKRISRYFKEEYATISRRLEQPVFFKEQLIHNYLYKGPVLEWYMRVKLRLEKYYQTFHDLLPMKGHILDLGCGYGFMSYMLHFAGPERQITGVDYDEEKIATANHCFSKTERIHFEHCDILDYSFGEYEGIVISDVLHYLPPAEQMQVIEKCIQSLRPGGVLLIRDGDTEKGNKHKTTRLTEFLSTRVFNFNKTREHRMSYLSGSTIEAIARDHDLTLTEIDNTKFTSNIIFVLKKKAQTDADL
ncbi:1-acyl-sn-glycerol-3-phosphate acyltransferase [Nostoc ellipsosporum NOK]|nr:1-acyl-sn-glycerol-3-phosphate acyltransferase [Nostoc ellipsosporum NOK]